MKSFDHCVVHASSDKIHRLPVEREFANGQTILNRVRTRCGALTTHMSDIGAEQVLDLPESLRCNRCFD